PKYGGMIIDIVSTDIRTSEQQSQALDAIKDTILAIVLIVVVGYDILFCFDCTDNK
ncbi:abc transporter b family member 27, partial [Fagus crenata]